MTLPLRKVKASVMRPSRQPVSLFSLTQHNKGHTNFPKSRLGNRPSVASNRAVGQGDMRKSFYLALFRALVAAPSQAEVKRLQGHGLPMQLES